MWGIFEFRGSFPPRDASNNHYGPVSTAGADGCTEAKMAGGQGWGVANATGARSGMCQITFEIRGLSMGNVARHQPTSQTNIHGV